MEIQKTQGLLWMILSEEIFDPVKCLTLWPSLEYRSSQMK